MTCRADLPVQSTIDILALLARDRSQSACDPKITYSLDSSIHVGRYSAGKRGYFQRFTQLQRMSHSELIIFPFKMTSEPRRCSCGSSEQASIAAVHIYAKGSKWRPSRRPSREQMQAAWALVRPHDKCKSLRARYASYRQVQSASSPRPTRPPHSYCIPLRRALTSCPHGVLGCGCRSWHCRTLRKSGLEACARTVEMWLSLAQCWQMRGRAAVRTQIQPEQ
jgi:hypothetical protein